MEIGLCAPSPGSNGGLTDSLDKAKAAFWTAWQSPLSAGGTDEISSP
jgi:hypothetical protein